MKQAQGAYKILSGQAYTQFMCIPNDMLDFSAYGKSTELKEKARTSIATLQKC